MNRILNILVFSFCIAFSVVSWAQKEDYDSYSVKKKSIDKNIEQEIFQLIQQKKNNPLELVSPLSELISEAIVENNNEAVAYGYYWMSRSYLTLEQEELALYYLELSEKEYQKKVISKKRKYESKEYNKSISRSKNLLSKPNDYNYYYGEIYLLKKDYNSALNYFNKTVKTAPSNKTRSLAKYAIANTYFLQNKLLEAKSSYTELLAIAKKENNIQDQKTCLSQLAIIAYKNNDKDAGNNYFEEFTKLLGNKLSETDIQLKDNIDNELIEKKDFQIQQANSDLFNSNVVESEISTNEKLILANSYYQNNNIEESEEALEEFLEAPSIENTKEKDIEFVKDLAEDFSKKNDNEKALKYLTAYTNIKDSIERLQASKNSKLQTVSEEGYKIAAQLNAMEKDNELSLARIDQLEKEKQYQNNILQQKNNLIYLLVFSVIAGAIAIIVILYIAKKRRETNKHLALKSLRTQMNPHFIYNSLNSVNGFISTNDERQANKYLTEFSKLMRSVLENSDYNFIPLSKELEILEIYVKLEHLRFKDKFDFKFTISDKLDIDFYQIPPMLVQPFIENAVWHGLRYKEEKGNLEINVNELSKGKLEISIKDNGIGRALSAELKTKNQKKTKSTAIKNIYQRIELLQSLFNIELKVEIIDLPQNSGTEVRLIIPQPHDHD